MNRSFILLFVIAFGTSCCNNHEPQPETRLIPAEMKAYWDFKPGSYWIYQDSLSGVLDSVYVAFRENYQFEGALSYNQETATCEYLGVSMRSSLDGYDYDYFINSQWASENPLFNVASCSKHKPGDFVDTHICFIYPFVSGIYSGTSYGDVTSFDSCLVRKVYSDYQGYADVVQVDNTFNSFEHYKRTRSYFAKHIGLFRYEVPDSNKYRILVDYHIEL